MNLLQKIGLIAPDEPTAAVAPIEMSLPELPVEVDAEIESSANVVGEIYAQNGLSDKSNSIFTVQALIDTLPEEMTTAKKQSTVSGILAVSGKSVASLTADAENRIEILKAAKGKIVGERTDEINTAKADIEKLKQLIEAASIQIKEAECIIEATEKSVEDEIKVITTLVEFCAGMEAAQ